MRVSCWWCGTENKSADAPCSHCGAPFDPKMQAASKPGLLGNYKTLIIEAAVLVICLVAVNNKFEQSQLQEYTPSYSNSSVTTPSPTPSPTPKQKPKQAGRRSRIDKEQPLLPTEQAPSPDIPPDKSSQGSRGVSSSSGYIRGPRGGCYYYSGSGRKVYVDRNLCN
jgi:hypothetical protein